MNPVKKFEIEREKRIRNQSKNRELNRSAKDFLNESIKSFYSYNFKWLGRPIIQYPQDMIAVQEIIWEVKPELIIETGIAHGGSLIFYASILELVGHGQVVGIDIDIRQHNRIEIESHSMFSRIKLIEGSSIDSQAVEQVKNMASGKKPVLVCLDSNHTYDHVRKELELYSDLVTAGSYLIVFDTIIEHMPETSCADRPWGRGDNPMPAVYDFLKTNDRFTIDRSINDQLLISVAPDGYLKCIKD